MSGNSMFRQWLLCAFLCIESFVCAAITLKGDSDAAKGETFSFRLQGAAMSTLPDIIGSNVYVTAHPSDGGLSEVREFAVARSMRGALSFLPLAPQTVTFNSAKSVANPLYDEGIAYFALFNGRDNVLGSRQDERPLIVLESDKTSIYLLNDYTQAGKDVTVLSVHNRSTSMAQNIKNIPDAAGLLTSGIVQIATANPLFFAAVGANGGSFGDVGSGIALGLTGEIIAPNPKTKEPGKSAPIIIDALTGFNFYSPANRAAPLDITSSQIKIGADLASLGTVVDLHWHGSMERLYIALQATGGAAGTDGALSIAIGRVDITKTENGNIHKLIIDAIVPTAAITGTDKIIGAVGSSVSVTAHKVRSLLSSTSLPYLIILGNVGIPSATKKTVFALPLVIGSGTPSIDGTIASKNALPEDVFAETKNKLFLTRNLKASATTAALMPLSTDAATQVGGGAILAGDITDLFVYQDAVFATVQSPDVGEAPGVFFSQPLFEQNGKIKSWTTWQRAVGLSDKTQSIFLDPITAQFTSLVANSSNQVKIVKRTEWGAGDSGSIKPFIEAVEKFMPQTIAGVQGVHSFPLSSTTPGATTPGLYDISLMVCTGLGKVMLAETSRIDAGAVVPIQGSDFGTLQTFQDGMLDSSFTIGSSRMIGIEGGVLDDLGPIMAAEVARDGSTGSNGWLFVGGTGGVAVLSTADGSGWAANSMKLADGFNGLASGMSFKKVGNFSNVRKLIHDDNYLYVISATEIVRIDLTLQAPGLGSINATTIIKDSQFPAVGSGGTFLDALVSEKLIIIGTSAGLFRLNDGLDARTVDSSFVSWKLLDTPEGIGPVRQLFAITQSGRAQDIARQANGGMFYALSAYRGKDQAQMHRFDVAQVTSSSISDSTVRRVLDLFVKNIPSFFVSYGMFRNFFATDGSLFFGTQSKLHEDSSEASVLFSKSGIQTGSRFLSNRTLPADLSESTLISGMLQNSATGTWLISGDHGLRANE